jgi:hypothetical protein
LAVDGADHSIPFVLVQFGAVDFGQVDILIEVALTGRFNYRVDDLDATGTLP